MAVTRRGLLGAAAGVALLGGRVSLAQGKRDLKPVTELGPHVLELDFPELHIGSAIYKEGPTGCTVFHFPKGARAIADVRGGAPATIFTDHLADRSGYVDAICLAGGSTYGLEASAGVASGLLAARGFATQWNKIACVSGAIIFDFGARENAVYPDRELGQAALKAAKPGAFPLGAAGAGASATCGKLLAPRLQGELAGQGGSFHKAGATRVAVFTVVNSLGAILDRKGAVVRGFLNPTTKKREAMPDGRAGELKASEDGGNTTLTVLVTNRQLDAAALRQLGRAVHTSMARAIQPFHAPTDGDVLFAVTTNEVDDAKLGMTRLTSIASECAWDAVLSSFRGR